MRAMKKAFHILTAIVVIPALLVIGVILWSYVTGNSLHLSITSSEGQQQPNFLLNASVQTENVILPGDETRDPVTGVRGYIQVSAQNLKSMTPAQYMEFYNQVIKDSSYVWFTVVDSEGTGLFIPDCADGSACFCSLDELGRQQEIYGYMIVTGDTCVYKEAGESTNQTQDT